MNIFGIGKKEKQVPSNPRPIETWPWELQPRKTYVACDKGRKYMVRLEYIGRSDMIGGNLWKVISEFYSADPYLNWKPDPSIHIAEIITGDSEVFTEDNRLAYNQSVPLSVVKPLETVIKKEESSNTNFSFESTAIVLRF